MADLRIARGFETLWLLGAAVEAGRRGENDDARPFLAESLAQFDRCPGFVGSRHLSLRIAADAAIEDEWADPGPWLTEAEAWFTARDLVPVARGAVQVQRVTANRDGKTLDCIEVLAHGMADGLIRRTYHRPDQYAIDAFFAT